MDSNHFYMRHRISLLFQYFKNFFMLLFFLFSGFRLKTSLLVENKGVEPLTLCVQGRCSSQLS